METVIFANGVIDNYGALSSVVDEDAFIIAADGGLKHVRALDLKPDLVIGDLDSISADDIKWLDDQGVEIIRHQKEKDETDLELALSHCLGTGADKITIYGATGGRLDQSLSNISLLSLPELEGKHIKYDDGREEIFLIDGELEVAGTPGDTVSLIPLFGKADGIITEGLKYPLRGETLYPAHTRGVSNVMEQEKVLIRVGSGSLLCIHTRAK